MTTVTIAVQGMHCSSCSILIDESLEELPGVVSASTDLRKELSTVDYDERLVTLDQITAEIASLGYVARAS